MDDIVRIVVFGGPFIPMPPAPSGAVEKTWYALARRFVARGHCVTLLSRHVAGLAECEVCDGVTVIRKGGWGRTGATLTDLPLDLLHAIRSASRIPDADIVVCNSFFLPMLLKKVRGIGNAALVVHLARFPKRQVWMYRHADAIQVPCEAVRDAVVDQCPSVRDKVKVIPYPVDLDDFGSNLATRRDQRSVIYAGRVHPEKGVHLLAAAVAQMANENVSLIIAGPVDRKAGGGGDGYRRHIESLAGRAPVHFVGNISSPSSLAKMLSNAAVFCYPSLATHGETFGIAPLEAMAAGTPPVVSDLRVFDAHVIDGWTGLRFDHRAEDPVSNLVEQLRKVLLDSSLWDSLSRAAIKHAGEFAMDKVAEMHLSHFASIAQASGT